ncbi:MAG: AraC-like DNA-binding protein [Cryomorphaceae bacterium]|jgi:AraC-like DNA-binding protein
MPKDTGVNMEIGLTILRIAAGSQLLVLAYLIGASVNPVRVRVLGVITMFGFFWSMMAPVVFSDLAPAFGSLFMYPAGWIVPSLLLFTCALFEDDLPIPLWVKLAVAVDITITLLFYTNLFGFAEFALAKPLIAAVKLCLVVGSIHIVLRGRKIDLIPQRVSLRLFLVGSIAWSTVPTLLVQLSSIPDINAAAYLFLSCVIFFNASVILIGFIKLNPDFELVRRPALSAQAPVDNDIAYLLDRMTTERLYADHSLRLKALADYIGWSEVKLRQKVNQDLGYRNFNQFINRFRLDEACVALLEQADKAVLVVALDVGFRSISSFNSVFQVYTGMNPTQYRQVNKN